MIIAVDPGSTGTAFAAGTQTLLPGAQMPAHKHLDQDEVLFVHKGQGRATLNERVIVVVPGAMLYVPRGAWHGLRNTGTGTLQIAWVSAPPGLEAFFRDLSRAGASPTAQTLQELAQRHRVEFRQAADAPAASNPPHRHRRRRRRRRATPSAAPQGRREKAGGAPPVSLAPPAGQPSRPAAGRQRPPRGRHRRRVREVYMGGRWVRVEGEGPVIAPGTQGPERRNPKPGGDDEPPAVRLSVPL
ncbi:MAG: cupin domain-containing protein [Candidatus Omnitrophica bacterium]|nr:cupin domain-containing protein [Candidatus Omnitrophota bacterium]